MKGSMPPVRVWMAGSTIVELPENEDAARARVDGRIDNLTPMGVIPCRPCACGWQAHAVMFERHLLDAHM